MKRLFMSMKQVWTTLEDYGYGWNEKGERFHALKSGRRQGRVNMIAALRNHQLMAPFTIEGSCNAPCV
ncbi:putative transposase [Tolypothrix sp. NIES-4075]|nr:putative transposase [Tolypothrix sp. NIES-4075]